MIHSLLCPEELWGHSRSRWMSELCLCSCWKGCLSPGSELCWPAPSPLLPQGQGRQWVCHQRPECAAGNGTTSVNLTLPRPSGHVFNNSNDHYSAYEGVQWSGSPGQSRLREDVPVDGHPHQRAAGHQAAQAVLHRGLGHRWLWGLSCELLASMTSPKAPFRFVSALLSLHWIFQTHSNSLLFEIPSSTAWSSCASTSPTRNCNSFSTTTYSCWSRRSTRRRASSGHSSTLGRTWTPARTSSRRFASLSQITDHTADPYLKENHNTRCILW